MNSRVVRGAMIGIEGNPYFEAAHAIGSPSWRTLLRHVWPNITIGWAIIAEASLSFLGFGLPPDVPSWGTLLSREGRQYMEMAPRLAMWPGVALTLVVYCLNMVGDALRDLLDPRLRGGGGALAGGVGTRAAERATKALQKRNDRAEPAARTPGLTLRAMLRWRRIQERTAPSGVRAAVGGGTRAVQSLQSAAANSRRNASRSGA